MKLQKKVLISALALVLVVVCAVGGTLAYLKSESGEVVNTFTYGDIDIELWETYVEDGKFYVSAGSTSSNSYKMIPGSELDKDPTVTVKRDSEACWLFIEVDASSTIDTYLSYEISSVWTALGDAYPNVYYYNGSDLDDLLVRDVNIGILDGDVVTVNSDVTKSDLSDLGSSYPTLKFKAYAVQKENVETAVAAWEIAKPSATVS